MAPMMGTFVRMFPALISLCFAISSARLQTQNYLIGVKFISYNIPDGTTATGDCCDEPGKTAGSCTPNLCDTSFDIRGARGSNNTCDIFRNQKTPPTYNNNSVHVGKRIGNGNNTFPSLIVMTIDYQKAQINFSITAREMPDMNTTGKVVEIATFDFVVDWTDPMFTRKPHYRRFVLNDTHMQLVMDIVSMCGKYHFTHNCSVYCRPNKLQYICQDNGTKICLPGWDGPNCNQLIDYCPGNKCEHGSTCVHILLNYTCACLPNFTGHYCEKIPKTASTAMTTPSTTTSTKSTNPPITVATVLPNTIATTRPLRIITNPPITIATNPSTRTIATIPPLRITAITPLRITANPSTKMTRTTSTQSTNPPITIATILPNTIATNPSTRNIATMPLLRITTITPLRITTNPSTRIATNPPTKIATTQPLSPPITIATNPSTRTSATMPLLRITTITPLRITTNPSTRIAANPPTKIATNRATKPTPSTQSLQATSSTMGSSTTKTTQTSVTVDTVAGTASSNTSKPVSLHGKEDDDVFRVLLAVGITGGLLILIVLLIVIFRKKKRSYHSSMDSVTQDQEPIFYQRPPVATTTV